MRTCELTLSFIPTTDNELTLFRSFGTLENWLLTSGIRDRKFDDRKEFSEMDLHDCYVMF